MIAGEPRPLSAEIARMALGQICTRIRRARFFGTFKVIWPDSTWRRKKVALPLRAAQGKEDVSRYLWVQEWSADATVAATSCDYESATRSEAVRIVACRNTSIAAKVESFDRHGPDRPIDWKALEKPSLVNDQSRDVMVVIRPSCNRTTLNLQLAEIILLLPPASRRHCWWIRFDSTRRTSCIVSAFVDRAWTRRVALSHEPYFYSR